MTFALLLLAAAALVALGLYVSFVHNLALFVGFALLLALAPAAQLPGADVSLLPLACLGLWVGVATRSRALPAPSWLELGAATLVVVSLFPLLAHGPSLVALSDYVRWAAAVLVALPLRWLAGDELARVARAYAYGTVGAAVLGLGLLLLDPGGQRLQRFSALGYAPDSGPTTAETSAGQAVRLIGPYAHPNIAVFLLMVGLVLAAAFLRGWTRAASVAVLAAAIVLTLSRAGLAGLLVAAVVMVVAGRGHHRTRALLAGGLVASCLALLAVPSVRARVLDSFGPRDIGTSARLDALRQFPDDMAGAWWLGHGFGSPEFLEHWTAGTANMAANAVLHTMLRGGVVTALALTALLIAALVAAHRRLRSGSLPASVVGAGVAGIVLVPVQLDIPLVTSVPVVASFSLLLAVLAHPTVLEAQPRTERAVSAEEHA